MVAFACPWCEDESTLLFAVLDEPESTFECTECGTSVAIVDEAATALGLAA
jgi:uncharacterized Zn finger protein